MAEAEDTLKKKRFINFRISPGQRARWEALARAKSMNLSEWFRYLAQRETDRQYRRPK
jgi:hypothetical protein